MMRGVPSSTFHLARTTSTRRVRLRLRLPIIVADHLLAVQTVQRQQQERCASFFVCRSSSRATVGGGDHYNTGTRARLVQGVHRYSFRPNLSIVLGTRMCMGPTVLYEDSAMVRQLSSTTTTTPGGGAGRRAPRRRRGARGGKAGLVNVNNQGGNDESALKSSIRHNILAPEPVLNDDDYKQACSVFLDRLLKALEPMKAHNHEDDFHIHVIDKSPHASTNAAISDHWELSITMRPGDGKYTISTDPDHLSILMSTPFSGSHNYVLCRDTREWRGDEDGHSLEGLLVRDLIRQCNGYPNF
jgi:hypothetical protein